MKIFPANSRTANPGPTDWFTGSVSIEPLLSAEPPSRLAGALVTFQPRARTVWHTHPLGQTLIITSGTGWVQREGGPVESVQAGDVVRFEPHERHWHGASPNAPMTHIAIQESLDGNVVTWLEPVSEEEYTA